MSEECKQTKLAPTVRAVAVALRSHHAMLARLVLVRLKHTFSDTPRQQEQVWLVALRVPAALAVLPMQEQQA